MPNQVMSEKLVHNIVLNQAISNTTPVNSTVVDTQDHNRELAFLVAATAFTSGSFALQMEEGDESDLSDAAAVSSDKLVLNEGPVTAASGANALARVSYFGTKRYVRLKVTGSSTPDATILVIAQRGGSIVPA